ncbi:MAG: hypothetical protein CMH52_11660 [Myxococcales bacterium]|nr:hypothetical protein [Myxococcales bacterium]|tara:strand:+ start:1178 stop:1501 length:324 start_codon:yes stop_codon:yes gene_type:complete
MRVLTPLVKPGQRLKKPIMSGGQLLFGAGTEMSRRYLRVIHEEGIRVVDLEPDPHVSDWETVPSVDQYVRGLDERFIHHQRNRKMKALKQAIKDVYLDFLFELESKE